MLQALYGHAAVLSLEDGLLGAADAFGCGVALRGALRIPGDSPEYAERLLRQTWLVWAAGAPPPTALLSLQQHCSPEEVQALVIPNI